MKSLKRIGLFLLTNMLVVVTLSILLNLLGVRGYLNESGIDYGALLVFCFVWGMGGAFISLLLSRFMAKMLMGVQVVDPRSPGQFGWLVTSVHDLARKAKLPMPEVGVYESPEVNAFATGPSASRSLVAVSTGLLSRMNKEEIEGVLGHEVAHIQNGDMVTMTLIQGVMNAFTMFLSRAIAYAISYGGSRDDREEGSPMMMGVITIVLDIVLGMLGWIVIAWFSRQREFRADRGSSHLLGGKRPMMAALSELGRLHGDMIDDRGQALATLKINGKRGGFMSLFSTHPPLEQRIAALERAS